MAELQVRIEAILRRVALERRHQAPLEHAACGELQFDEACVTYAWTVAWRA